MTIQRKQLQKRIQKNYQGQLLKESSGGEDGNLVFELKLNDPRTLAYAADMKQRAHLNRKLLTKINSLSSWQDLQVIVDNHDRELTYITVSHICAHLPRIQVASESQLAEGPPFSLLNALSSLVLTHAHSFQPQHYAQCASGLAAVSFKDHEFWKELIRASSRRLVSFTAPSLASLTASVATAGFMPSLGWVQACERQLARHIHNASPEVLSAMLWSWGTFNYTPKKKVIDGTKMMLRDAMKHHKLSPQLLLQILYGMARLTAHHPGERWLLAWANEFAPHMRYAHPAVLVEVLLSLVSLQFQPTQQWMGHILRYMSQGLKDPPRQRAVQGQQQGTPDVLPARQTLDSSFDSDVVLSVPMSPTILTSNSSHITASPESLDNLEDQDLQALLEWEEDDQDSLLEAEAEEEGGLHYSSRVQDSKDWSFAEQGQIKNDYGLESERKGRCDARDPQRDERRAAREKDAQREQGFIFDRLEGPSGATVRGEEEEEDYDSLLEHEEVGEEDKDELEVEGEWEEDLDSLLGEDDYLSSDFESQAGEDHHMKISEYDQTESSVDGFNQGTGSAMQYRRHYTIADSQHKLPDMENSSVWPEATASDALSPYTLGGVDYWDNTAYSSVSDFELSCVPAPDLQLLWQQGAPASQHVKVYATQAAHPGLASEPTPSSGKIVASQPKSAVQPLRKQPTGQDSTDGGAEPGSSSTQAVHSNHQHRFLSWRLSQRDTMRQQPTTLGPLQLAQLAWCLDTLDYLPEPSWMSSFISRAEAGLPQAGPAELADLLQGIAGIDYLPDNAFMGAAVHRLWQLAPGLPAEPLRRCLRALMRIGCRPPAECLDAMIARACQVASGLGPLGICDVMIAAIYLSEGFEASNTNHELTHNAVSTASSSALGSSGEGNSSSAFSSSSSIPSYAGKSAQSHPHKALGSAQPYPTAWSDILVETSLPLLPTFPPDRLAGIGWSVALLVTHHRANKPSEEWLHEWLVCCRARFKLLDARDLATVAWAASCLRHRPGPVWIEEFTREAGRRLRFFDAQALTDLCWALASFGFTPDDSWLQRLEAELMNRSVEQAATSSNVRNTGSKTHKNVNESLVLSGELDQPDNQPGTETDSSSSSSSSSGPAQYLLLPHHMSVILWALQCFKWVPRQQGFVQAAESMFVCSGSL
ncbi:hypothetical protein CEUSTIGMA_g1598.t1 [Chlamydomonas eustigma]|uniref:Uncharacterized protein n=1 Tax=Chlamydomonas eustigma TaxID=1157962 RepID=A0A250WTT4_9CHLO|nr:hypothetical protein CEUSTIGMA_g1598.t1 [Chlamydomonas eustigma]|eukprot:GAX74149.1 hypothetical protein CEUSTIGMA_g1598.t1 [Chlamydomonas eustigma]